MNRINTLIAAAALACSGAASAAMLDLSTYSVSTNVTIDALAGMGLEASAVTYARDRNSLFIVGDEGLGVVELSLSGQTLGTMAFNWAGTGSSNNDAEGLTYLGNGRLVVVDERPQMAYQFSFAAGTTLALNSQPKVAITGSATSVGNFGTEGISYDPRDGRFWSVKQDNPAELRVATLNFAVGGGTASSTTLFSGATSIFGLDSLSDIQTLAGVDRLAGDTGADNLLLLSLDSRRLVEINRAGQILSSLDLSGITQQALEGVTIDALGNIYLVAEDSGTGNSRLITLTSPIPEPATYALFASGLGLLAWRRRVNRS